MIEVRTWRREAPRVPAAARDLACDGLQVVARAVHEDHTMNAQRFGVVDNVVQPDVAVELSRGADPH